jgi:E3 ubiquitin-protein ligase XIAP
MSMQSTSGVLPHSSIIQRPLNLKREADRRKTFTHWSVPFMDIYELPSAGFFYTNLGDVVRCAFCDVEVGKWEKGDVPIIDHLRWSPSCGFAKGLNTKYYPVIFHTTHFYPYIR